jgi:hypothetical protein
MILPDSRFYCFENSEYVLLGCENLKSNIKSCFVFEFLKHSEFRKGYLNTLKSLAISVASRIKLEC